MKLYIEVENGVVKNHPAMEDNLIQAFGSIPENWEPFVRVVRPTLTAYQVLESENPVYTKVDGVWTDVWTIREMTEEEKTVKQQALDSTTATQAVQQAVKDFWATLPNRENFSAWTFDEKTCQYLPPTPRPTEGDFRWDGATNSWVPRT
jgi:hypothetical protein